MDRSGRPHPLLDQNPRHPHRPHRQRTAPKRRHRVALHRQPPTPGIRLGGKRLLGLHQSRLQHPRQLADPFPECPRWLDQRCSQSSGRRQHQHLPHALQWHLPAELHAHHRAELPDASPAIRRRRRQWLHVPNPEQQRMPRPELHRGLLTPWTCRRLRRHFRQCVFPMRGSRNQTCHRLLSLRLHHQR